MASERSPQLQVVYSRRIVIFSGTSFKPQLKHDLENTQNEDVKLLYSGCIFVKIIVKKSRLTVAHRLEIQDFIFMIFAYSAERVLDFLASVWQKKHSLKDYSQTFCIQYNEMNHAHLLFNVSVHLLGLPTSIFKVTVQFFDPPLRSEYPILSSETCFQI